jgi:hypothetical protein
MSFHFLLCRKYKIGCIHNDTCTRRVRDRERESCMRSVSDLHLREEQE